MTTKIGTSCAVLVEDGGWATVEDVGRLFRNDSALIYFLGMHFVTQRIQGRVNLEDLVGRSTDFWLPIVRTERE